MWIMIRKLAALHAGLAAALLSGGRDPRSVWGKLNVIAGYVPPEAQHALQMIRDAASGGVIT